MYLKHQFAEVLIAMNNDTSFSERFGLILCTLLYIYLVHFVSCLYLKYIYIYIYILMIYIYIYIYFD